MVKDENERIPQNMKTNGYDNPIRVTDNSPNEQLQINLEPNGNTRPIDLEFRKKTTQNGKDMYIINANVTTTRENACQFDEVHLDYKPYDNYHQQHPTTFLGTAFHMLKASFGTGLLAMPNAFSNAGWLLGTLGTLLVGFLCTHNMQTVISSEYKLCKKRRVPSMTYPETMECAFEEGPQNLRWLAPHFKFMTNLFLIFYQIGISSVYVVFMANNFTQVYETCAGDKINVRWMMVYLLVPLILIGWVRHLKLLVPFSTLANAVGMLSFVMICTYIFHDVPSLNEREPVGTISSIPLFFGTVLFAMEAIGAVFPLKNAMEEPHRFSGLCGVLSVSMVSVTLAYAFLGFFGYLKYGSATEPSITLNLPMNGFLPNAVKILYSLSIYVTYALSNFVILDIVWTNGIRIKAKNMRYKIVWEYVVRTSIALLTFVLAFTAPDLELFISFTGSFCLATIGIAFPAIADTLVHWQDSRDNTLQFTKLMFKNAIIVLIAVFAFTIGVGTTVVAYFKK